MGSNEPGTHPPIHLEMEPRVSSFHMFNNMWKYFGVVLLYLFNGCVNELINIFPSYCLHVATVSLRRARFWQRSGAHSKMKCVSMYIHRNFSLCIWRYCTLLNKVVMIGHGAHFLLGPDLARKGPLCKSSSGRHIPPGGVQVSSPMVIRHFWHSIDHLHWC